MSETFAGALLAIMTGATCGDACWHAREDICRCSCGGANHGILNHGGERPQRTCRIDGELFELVAIVPGRVPGESWAPIDMFKAVDACKAELYAARFPDISTWGYGEYRLGGTLPVVDRKLSASQSRWPEVQAVPGAYRLVWARPKGSRYVVRTPDHKHIWKDGQP